MHTSDRPEVCQRPRRRSVALVSSGLLAALYLASAARANDKRSAPTPLLANYAQECAACHLRYPPGMLPAASWQRLMGNLPRHFGADAFPEPAATLDIIAGARLLDIVAVWRYIDYEMKSASPIESLILDGPSISAAFRW